MLRYCSILAGTTLQSTQNKATLFVFDLQWLAICTYNWFKVGIFCSATEALKVTQCKSTFYLSCWVIERQLLLILKQKLLNNFVLGTIKDSKVVSAIKEFLPLNLSFLHNKIAIVEEETKEYYVTIQYIIENGSNLKVVQNEGSNGPKWILQKILDDDGTIQELSGTQKRYLSKFEKWELQ